MIISKNVSVPELNKHISLNCEILGYYETTFIRNDFKVIENIIDDSNTNLIYHILNSTYSDERIIHAIIADWIKKYG